MTSPRPAADPDADTPFLPPAAPVAPASERSGLAPPTAPVEAAEPVYGAMPAGTDASRAAARQLREQANRKRRRGRASGRIAGVLVLAGVGVGGYLVYRALQDDPSPTDDTADARPSADDSRDSGTGALLDTVDDARDVVGQAEPPVAGTTLLVADLLTPAVLDHTDVLVPADGYERFVVRTVDLAAIDPNSHADLVARLLGFAQAVPGEPQLAAAPVVPPGDIGIAIQRDGDTITRLVAVGTDPTIRSVGP